MVRLGRGRDSGLTPEAAEAERNRDLTPEAAEAERNRDLTPVEQSRAERSREKSW